MIDREEFFRRVKERRDWLDIDQLSAIVKSMISEEDEQEVLESYARERARELIASVKDQDGNRVYHNIKVGGKRVWKQEDLFGADDYHEVISYEEREIERRIAKTQRLRDNARRKGIEIQLRFELTPA